VGSPGEGPASGTVEGGTLHVAVPFDPAWKLTVDGQQVPARRAFGTTMAFDVESGGNARLEYETPLSRSLWLVVQMVAWLAVAMAATRFRPSSLLARRRRGTALQDTTLIADLSTPLAPVVERRAEGDES